MPTWESVKRNTVSTKWTDPPDMLRYESHTEKGTPLFVGPSVLCMDADLIMRPIRASMEEGVADSADVADVARLEMALPT